MKKKPLSLYVDMFFRKKKKTNKQTNKQTKNKLMYGLDSWWASSQVFQYHDTRTFAEGFKLLKTLKCIAINYIDR